MLRPAPFLMLVLAGLTAGCESFRTSKFDNPVVTKVPPRVAPQDLEIDRRNYSQLERDNDSQVALASAASGVIPASGSSQSAIAGLDGTQIVAMVNGRPILAAEVLEPFSPQMMKIDEALRQGKATAAQKEEFKRKAIEHELPRHVDRMLLLAALELTLKKDQLQELESQLDRMFKDSVEGLMKQEGTPTTYELDQKLHGQGTSLQALREAFGRQQKAEYYLAQNAPKAPTLNRSDLIAYYQEHAADFRIAARVTWREIVVPFADAGGESAAAAVVKAAITDLRDRQPFADVAQKHSLGFSAKQGGLRDWTDIDSLEDELVNALSTTPVGEISEVIIGANSFRIVQIVDREDARLTPFGDVQDTIRKTIIKKHREDAAEEVILKLRADADIRTIFDPKNPL